ncbi:hypothetical protein Q5P01_004893 [Channa striata]|uniref:Uncharacterized protein n=1 Tax=Channa striata TaxID=64152 RepID=A0AA88NGJ9_CHASR|nr:hypothetical protein Q5P01_004893 [Channa striata]
MFLSGELYSLEMCSVPLSARNQSSNVNLQLSLPCLDEPFTLQSHPAGGSKRHCSTGWKPLVTQDEITVRPTSDFLLTQEMEAQLRGKGTFLCHPQFFYSCSSRVLLHDPCFVLE